MQWSLMPVKQASGVATMRYATVVERKSNDITNFCILLLQRVRVTARREVPVGRKAKTLRYTPGGGQAQSIWVFLNDKANWRGGDVL